MQVLRHLQIANVHLFKKSMTLTLQSEISESKERVCAMLNRAMKVCYNADEDNSYPYACGYAKETMRSVLEELNYLETLYEYQSRNALRSESE